MPGPSAIVVMVRLPFKMLQLKLKSLPLIEGYQDFKTGSSICKEEVKLLAHCVFTTFLSKTAEL